MIAIAAALAAGWPSDQTACAEMADAGPGDRRTFVCGDVAVSTGIHHQAKRATRAEVARFIAEFEAGLATKALEAGPGTTGIGRRGPDAILRTFHALDAGAEAPNAGLAAFASVEEGLRYYICSPNHAGVDPDMPCLLRLHQFVHLGPPPEREGRLSRVEVGGAEVRLPAPCVPTTLAEWPNAVRCPDGATLGWMGGTDPLTGAELDAALDALVNAATGFLRTAETRDVDYRTCEVTGRTGRCATVSYGVNHVGGVIVLGVGSDAARTVVVICMQIGTAAAPTESCRALLTLR